MTAMSDLLAQRNEVERQIAELSLPALADAKDLLVAKPATTLVAEVEALMAQLPDGEARNQLGNVVTVLVHVPQFIAAEHDRVSALLAPAPQPEAPAAPAE